MLLVQRRCKNLLKSLSGSDALILLFLFDVRRGLQAELKLSLDTTPRRDLLRANLSEP